jgi:hypothetical protein
MHYTQARSPRALLKRLAQEGALPASLRDNDILGVSVHDGTLLINLSDRYGELLRAAADQRIAAYSAVTTLCSALDVRRVRFYFGGYSLDTLDGDLIWSGEFLYNPALVE